MIKTSFKQAWAMMKQNRLFTTIYVAGTGLSVAFTLILFIIYYVKFAPIYPEYNRNRTLVVNNMSAVNKENDNNYSCNSGVNARIFDLLKDLPHLDKMAAASNISDFLGVTVVIPETNEQYSPLVQLVNQDFWEVFTFRFVSGHPFTEADVASTLPKAILSESMAKRIFAQTDVAGRYISLDGKDVQVCGVVKDASTATSVTMGEVYLPLYWGGLLSPEAHYTGLTGNIQLYLLSKDDDVEALRTEVQEVVKQHSLQDKYDNKMFGQPDTWWENYFRTSCAGEPDIASAIRGILYMLLAFLFIPALNLCGMISSRMDERMSELGVRKAYGATNRSIVHQVLTENLLLTLVGGLLGLALAYTLVCMGGELVLSIFNEDMYFDRDYPMAIHLEMLINLPLFLTVLGVCVLLNLISALVPTIVALRHPIIYSIHSKR